MALTLANKNALTAFEEEAERIFRNKYSEHELDFGSLLILTIIRDHRSQIALPDDFLAAGHDKEKTVNDALGKFFANKRILALADRTCPTAHTLSLFGAKVIATTIDTSNPYYEPISKERAKESGFGLVIARIENALDDKDVKALDPDFVLFSNINAERFPDHPANQSDPMLVEYLRKSRSSIKGGWNELLERILGVSPHGSVYFIPTTVQGVSPAWSPEELHEKYSGRFSYRPQRKGWNVYAIHPKNRIPPHAEIF